LAGLTTTYAMGTYSASKHAVVGLAATLADELRPAGVGVSVLCPGPFRTRIFDSERLRPAELAGDTHAAPEVVELYHASVDASGDPADLADAVHDGVVGDQLFILTSPELQFMIEQRCDAIRAAFAPLPTDGDHP
jgi:NAD(P)-dependent dehydrogenase (short-subunit alcohol dehydrogenase family)